MKIHSQNAELAISQQVVGILRAGIGQGISAFEYYHFQLYQKPASSWWQYVFDYQLPYFHSVYQRFEPTAISKQFMLNKGVFADTLKNAGGRSVATLDIIELNAPWPINDWLNLSRRVFIKPEGASGSKGCVCLYETDNWQFEYQADVYSGTAGLQALKAQLPKGNYIIQPCLENHPQLNVLQQSSKVITLRVVTCFDADEPIVVMANLELNNDSNKRMDIFVINIDDGSVQFDGDSSNPRDSDGFTPIVLPHWDDVLLEVIKAHQLCKDIHTVGWDVVITIDGVLLLEGNVNWGINVMQVVRQQPLLPLLSKASSRYRQSS
ncbi:sugar-transfer associated ATP-grasp domain-containing protein [Shewanella sp. 10N.286.45.A1]|uniref:sugar-transfer associated ATP-grasp domain-containing protein n=1 Tax=Shewanella sp. 10N.286.45.A1 TaxID=3229694 RepID=UPI003553898B